MPSLSVADEIKAATEAMERMAITKTSRFAAHAACVVPVSKTIGNALVTTEKVVTSVNAFVAQWNIVIDRLGFVMHALKPICEIFPCAKSAWEVISFIPTQISKQNQLEKSMIDLLKAMELSLDLAPNPDALRSRCGRSDNHGRTLARLLEQIKECGHFIQSYAKDDKFWKRMLKNIVNDKKTVIDKYRQALKTLRDDFLSEVIVTVDMNVFRIITEVASIAEGIKDLDIDMKLCATGTRFHPAKGCLPQTRVKFLEAIMEWANDPDPASSMNLILFGQAGTGKSTIAHEVARRFHDMGRLTTSYFFDKRSTFKRESYRFFATLARDLCSRCPAYKVALGKSIDNNPDVIYAQDYSTLFDLLLRDPLENVYFVGPVFIVIDALDESEDVTAGTPYIGDNDTHFHTFLAKRLSELPSNFRILISPRPEPEILRAFSDLSAPSFIHMEMADPVLSCGVGDDIGTYLHTKLSGTTVDEHSLRELTRKAEHSFQWASVASHYVANPPKGLDFMQCIDRVLRPTDRGIQGLNPLDTLYTTVLKIFNMEDPDIRDNFRSVMGQIVGACQPLSIASLNLMNGHAATDGSRSNSNGVSVIVSHLGSLLSNVTPSNSIYPIAPLHTSFRDFLTDERRSGKFYINLDNAHRQLAFGTLRTMHQSLRFNICELETSHRLNSEVVDLSKRIEKHISPALSYSCRFWAEHLSMLTAIDVELFTCLCDFMEEKFLFWLEVLSVEGELANATMGLLSLGMWLVERLDEISGKTQNERIATLQELVYDAIHFVRYFGIPISQSTPHIYLSALPFAPSSSIIYKLYSPRFPYTPRVQFGGLFQWPPLQMTISAPNKKDVVCVASSRNNEYIAAGLDDGFVCVWNTLTGMRVCGPLDAFEGHLSRDGDEELDDVPCVWKQAGEEEKRDSRGFVSSVAFSHDGRCLATGTSDGRIHIWNVSTGQETVVGCQQRTWKRHMGAVSSLFFSQDDKQLMSGSKGGQVLILDLENGEVIAKPFPEQHHVPMRAVSFLLDQENVLSRSGFHTVRTWNMKTGESKTHKLFEEMDIPTGKVDSVVHYHDGVPFDQVSCHGKSSFPPRSYFEAMENYAPTWQSNVCYWSQIASSDGKLISTSSQNRTHIWYAKGVLIRRLAGGPFSDDRLTCLAFSANGKQVVSGSRDGVVRVWNVGLLSDDVRRYARKELLVPCSAVFDGPSILVGWQDGTVQVLDAETGQEQTRMKRSDRNKKEDWAEVTISRHGDWLSLVHGRKIYVLSANGLEVLRLSLVNHGNETIITAFSPDADNLLAYCTTNKTSVVAWIVDVSTRAVIAGPKYICDRLAVSSLALSKNLASQGSTRQIRVAVGCSHGETFVWDVNSGVMGPFTHHRDPVKALIFGDGCFITSVATDHTLCVWDSTTGNLLRRSGGISGVQKTHWGYSRNWPVALTQDGRRVAFVGKDHTILMFEVPHDEADSEIALKDPLVLAGHLDDVSRMSFSRDGLFLATTSADYTVRVWNLKAAVENKLVFMHSASDTSGPTNFDETVIDNDGWAIRTRSHGRSPLRLMWIPEIHRESLHRSSNMCVVGREMEIRLDLTNFVHGKDWVKCIIRSDSGSVVDEEFLAEPLDGTVLSKAGMIQ